MDAAMKRSDLPRDFPFVSFFAFDSFLRLTIMLQADIWTDMREGGDSEAILHCQ